MLRDSELAPTDGEISIYEGTTKQRLLEKILKSGVKILYLARPFEIGYDDGKLCGLKLATKHGVMFLRAKHIIDSRGGLCSALASGESLDERDSVPVTIIPRVINVKDASPRTLTVGEATVTVHPAKRRGSPDECRLEISFTLGKDMASGHLSPFTCRAAGVRTAINVLRELRVSDPAFESAVITYFPYESIAEPFVPFDGSAEGITRIDRLYGETADPAVEKALFGHIKEENEPELPDGISPYSRIDDERLPVALYHADFSGKYEIIGTEAAVAGLGAGGEAAMIPLTRHGKEVVACENKPQLGGTRVVSGVVAYWHGYHGGWNQEIIREKNSFEKNLGGKLFGAGETLEDAWLSGQLLGNERCRVLTGTVFGANTDDKKCRGFFAATDQGVFRVERT